MEQEFGSNHARVKAADGSAVAVAPKKALVFDCQLAASQRLHHSKVGAMAAQLRYLDAAQNAAGRR